ncbi:MAG: acyl--CoA ligase [Nitrospirae bacterium]|nr:acyl--CoA ligase [Nitrospirota bacterium]
MTRLGNVYTLATLTVVRRMLTGRVRAALSPLNPAILGHRIEMEARKSPDAIAYIFENGDHPEERITRRQLNQRSHALAHELLARGLKPGDRFAVFSQNYPEMLYAFAAASLTGTVAVPIDPRNRGDLLTYILDHSQSKLLIFADNLDSEAKEVLPKVPAIKHTFVIESERPPGSTGFPPVLPILNSAKGLDPQDRAKDMWAPFQIIYTSGTTGNPKGVVQPNVRFFFMSMLGHFFGYRRSDILYTGLSLSHGNSQGVTVYPALELGIPAVISRRFTKKRIWDVTRRYGITSFSPGRISNNDST